MSLARFLSYLSNFFIFSRPTSTYICPLETQTGRAEGKGPWGLSSRSPSLSTDDMDTAQLGRSANFLPLTGNVWVPAAAWVGCCFRDVREVDEAMTMFTGKVKHWCGMMEPWTWCKHHGYLQAWPPSPTQKKPPNFGQRDRGTSWSKPWLPCLLLPTRGKLEVRSAANAGYLHPSYSVTVFWAFDQGCLESPSTGQQVLLHKDHSWDCSFSDQVPSLVLVLVLPLWHFKSRI